MLRLLAGEPNVLLLDEPTNDLDTDTLAALEDLLDTWPGTMVIASHDRYLVERVTDHVYGMFGDGRLVHLPGGVDEYLARAALRGAPGESAVTPATSAVAVERPSGARTRGSESGPTAAESRTARKEVARLERTLDRLAQQAETAARGDGRARDRLRADHRAGQPASRDRFREGRGRGGLAGRRRTRRRRLRSRWYGVDGGARSRCATMPVERGARALDEVKRVRCHTFRSIIHCGRSTAAWPRSPGSTS